LKFEHIGAKASKDLDERESTDAAAQTGIDAGAYRCDISVGTNAAKRSWYRCRCRGRYRCRCRGWYGHR
jgi:hypothetical protein